MENSRYNLIINSSTVTNENVANARQQMSSFFKLRKDEVDKLFCNKPLRIVKEIDYMKAQQYRNEIVKMGMTCKIELAAQNQERQTSSPTTASFQKQENQFNPRTSESALSLADKEDQQSMQNTKTYLCPSCELQQANKHKCDHCNYNLDSYRDSMKEKGFAERPGEGYFKERRGTHRRSNKVRREKVRLGKNSDRRSQEERRKESGDYTNAF